jgi:hypothetical protein
MGTKKQKGFRFVPVAKRFTRPGNLIRVARFVESGTILPSCTVGEKSRCMNSD